MYIFIIIYMHICAFMYSVSIFTMGCLLFAGCGRARILYQDLVRSTSFSFRLSLSLFTCWPLSSVLSIYIYLCLSIYISIYLSFCLLFISSFFFLSVCLCLSAPGSKAARGRGQLSLGGRYELLRGDLPPAAGAALCGSAAAAVQREGAHICIIYMYICVYIWSAYG